MSQTYSSWSLEKLKKERNKIDKAIANAEKRDKKATLAKMAAVARQNGFEMHELMADASLKGSHESKSRPASKSGKSRGKVPPKYHNPANTSQTWTGRGRQPLWVKELLDSGSTLEELSIASAAG